MTRLPDVTARIHDMAGTLDGRIVKNADAMSELRNAMDIGLAKVDDRVEHLADQFTRRSEHITTNITNLEDLRNQVLALRADVAKLRRPVDY